MTRRTNVGLLVLLPVAFATGWLAFAVGSPAWGAVVVGLHGVAGLGVLVLSPWKSAIVRRGLRRARPDRAGSIALAGLVLVVVGTGLAHAFGLTGPVLGVTGMQVHVGAALLAVPLLAMHVLARPSRPRRADLSRRSLVRSGALLGVAGLTWSVTQAPERRFTGSHRRAAAAMPVTQWMFDTVPRVDPVAWRLTVLDADGGRELSLADLGAGDGVRAVLDCTGGWYAEQDWEGVRLDRLLGAPGAALSVLVRSATGYTRRFPVTDLPRLWLATSAAGLPLSPGHGAPARLVAPGRRGFHWVKWVDRVELSDLPAWRQPPFPLR